MGERRASLPEGGGIAKGDDGRSLPQAVPISNITAQRLREKASLAYCFPLQNVLS